MAGGSVAGLPPVAHQLLGRVGLVRSMDEYSLAFDLMVEGDAVAAREHFRTYLTWKPAASRPTRVRAGGLMD